MRTGQNKRAGREREGRKWQWDLMQPGSHDKPNSETQGLFLISTPCLNLYSFLASLPSLARFAVSFAFCIFLSWCEMNIKAMLWQLGGLQRNLIGLHGPLYAAATILAATTPQSAQGGDEASLESGTPGRVRGNLRKLALR